LLSVCTHRLVARTVVVKPLGSHVLVTAKIADQLVKVMTGIDAPIKAGDDLWLRPITTKLRWFDPASGQEIAG
jgi:ABC-type sugar transport system ATPase subunit